MLKNKSCFYTLVTSKPKRELRKQFHLQNITKNKILRSAKTYSENYNML